MNFSPIDHAEVKHGFTTHAVPLDRMAGVKDLDRVPQIGDLVLAEVLALGHHTRIEHRSGAPLHIFPGDLVMGAFGNRYATDQYEAYVPKELGAECHLVSIGGVCGEVVSQHPSMDPPTRLRIVGGVCDDQGRLLNLRAFGLPPHSDGARGVILVVGSAMNAGKTTTVGTLARALKQGGSRVAAAKITGTAAGKDPRYFVSCGAKPVLDFTYAGYPSTYMLSLEELMGIHRTLVGHLRKANPEHIIVEVADGIFQRETRMLLDNVEFRQSIAHVFFAASDSLSAECGARAVKAYGLPLRALAGAFTQSPLAMREAEAATGFRCLSVEQMMLGGVLETMGIDRTQLPPRVPVKLPEQTRQPALPSLDGNGEPDEVLVARYAAMV
jgi:hypothetical protein